MRFPAKKNVGCPKAPRDFPPRKDGILYPHRVVLELPPPHLPLPQSLYGRAGHVRWCDNQNFSDLIGYQSCLAMVLLWRAMRAGSAISTTELKNVTS